MAGDEKKERLEIGHVLFVDIIGYSKLLIDEQTEALQELNQAVRNTETFREADAAGKLIRLPTGDGMALVFTNSVDAPVECALQISQALRAKSNLPVRMGIHSGPVNYVSDVNERANIAGAGINLAQRIMDCADAGHILMSKRVADDLAQYRRWQPYLNDLGECEVKHGTVVSIVNFCADDVGNPAMPAKIAQTRESSAKSAGWSSTILRWAASALVATAIVASFVLYRQHQSSRSTDVAASGKSIAVLPFENLSEDKTNAFFADGVQDEVLTNLSKVADLKVISRTSVMGYRGTTGRSSKKIGAELGVSHIVEGSVQRAGNRVRVNAQLIDTQSDGHLWAESYDRDLADIFAIQSEIARTIVDQLRARLAPEERNRIDAKATNNPEAYLFYLQAKDAVRTAGSKTAAFKADELYDRAIALDPAFALARARASMLNSLIYYNGRDLERKAKAHALADEALRLAPGLGEAHLARAFYLYRTEQDHSAALQELKIAGEALPNSAEIAHYSGTIYSRRGHWREALKLFERVQQLDPLQTELLGRPTALLNLRQWDPAAEAFQELLQISPQSVPSWVGLAYVEFCRTGQPAKATETLDRISELLKGRAAMTDRWDYFMFARDFKAADAALADFPPNEFTTVEPPAYYQGCSFVAQGDLERAHQLFEQVRLQYEAGVRDHPADPVFYSHLGHLYALLGRKEDAIRLAKRACELCPISADAIRGAVYQENLAFVYSQTGAANEAIDLISRLLTTPAANRITLAHLRVSWEWDPLRKDPRFEKILASPEPATVYE